MDNSTPIFFDNLDVFAAQYVEVYERLKKEYPWLSSNVLMVKSKEITIEYLYLKLKEDLKVKPVWPKDFEEQSDCATKGSAI